MIYWRDVPRDKRGNSSWIWSWHFPRGQNRCAAAVLYKCCADGRGGLERNRYYPCRLNATHGVEGRRLCTTHLHAALGLRKRSSRTKTTEQKIQLAYAVFVAAQAGVSQ